MSKFFIDTEDFTKSKPPHTKISSSVAISNQAIEDKLVFTGGEIITFINKANEILKAPCLVVLYEKKPKTKDENLKPRAYHWFDSRDLAINTMIDTLGEFREDLSVNWRDREKQKAISSSSIITMLKAQRNCYQTT